MRYISLLVILLFAGCTVVAHDTSIITDDQMGSLSFDVRPKDAKIYVDGEFVGLAKYFDGQKRKIKILPGEHIIMLRRQGYQDIAKKIYMSDTQEHFSYDMAGDIEKSGTSRFVIRT